MYKKRNDVEVFCFQYDIDLLDAQVFCGPTDYNIELTRKDYFLVKDYSVVECFRPPVYLVKKPTGKIKVYSVKEFVARYEKA